jgi:hypothetical protein
VGALRALEGRFLGMFRWLRGGDVREQEAHKRACGRIEWLVGMV